jgi:hypothetical protein
VGRTVIEDERAVGKLVQGSFVVELRLVHGRDALGMELRVDRVGAGFPRVELAPDLAETDIVGATAERARAVSRGERGRLVEEEQLRESAGLEQRPSSPAPELEPAGNPPFAVVAPADPTPLVVEAAAVSVDEAACRVGDELAEWGHAILQWHGLNGTSA